MSRPHPAPGGPAAAATATPEAVWRGWLPGLDLPRVGPGDLGREVLVCSAHPDDDVLGAGGLLHVAASTGVRVRFLVATDGEASHPGSRSLTPAGLARRRVQESLDAWAALGVPPVAHTRLRLPDGGLAAVPGRLAGAVEEACDGVDAVLAPWAADAHPDHDAVGRAAARAAARAGVPLLAFPVWAWEWALPADPRLPWDRAVAADVGATARVAKRRAVDRFASQVRAVGPAPEDAAVLPGTFLEHFDRDVELFFRPAAGGGDR